MAKTVQKRRSAVGQALVDEGVITPEQLQRALRVQSLLEEPKRLGEVLIELGYATRQAVTEAITKHGVGIRLGDMLVEQGIITLEALDMALAIQRGRGVRLGEALIQLGAINKHTLIHCIAHQAGVPFIEPTLSMIDPNLLRGVSPSYLTKHQFVPFSKNEEGRVTVVVSDLNNNDTRQAVDEMYQGNAIRALGPEEAICSSIEDFQRFREKAEDKSAPDVQFAEDPVVALVKYLFSQAIEQRASDIHIEPMTDKIRVRYRIDGVLVHKTDLPLDLLPKIISRIKILADCNISEHQKHQGGRLLFAYGEKEIDMRLSIYVTVYGESAVLRVLNKELALVSLDELGMSASMMERYRTDVLDLSTGVVLITGPTGSGKTTTMYSSIDYCNDLSRKIITAEDPVEFTIEGITQCSIFDKVGRSFEMSLREMVRQDPDIIVMGEIRDKTTAQVAIQAALTGHKVFSTFHTEDTIGGLLRLIDMEIETFLISSTVISIVAQRLLRRICQKCSAPYMPSAKEIQAVGLDIAEVRQYEYYRGRGCNHCAHTGYRGRVAAYELLVLDEEVKEAILQKKTAHEIRKISVETTGLVSMREDGVAKVVKGLTTFEEVLNRTPRTFDMHPLRQIASNTTAPQRATGDKK